MKRILAILCVIACLCGLCVPAMAAGNITVSVKAPDDWTSVNLYVWGNGEYATWPGTAMTKGADGWWTLSIPAGYTSVIANNGTAQTVDLKMGGSEDAWLVVTDQSGEKFNGVVYTDADCTKPFDAPAVTYTSLSIVGTGIFGLNEWDVESNLGDMNTEGDGVYTRIMPMVAGTMMFKIAANHKWDVNFGGANAGMVVTPGTAVDMVQGGQDLTMTLEEDCTLKFTFTLTATGGSLLVEVTDEDPDEAPEIPEEPTPGVPEIPEGEGVTIYAKVPNDWNDVRVWCWDGNNQNPSMAGDWPGAFAMTKGADGWYSVVIPKGYTNLLINGNGGAVQTPDITGLEADKDVWINAYTKVNEPQVAYEVITDIAEPDEGETPDVGRPLVPPTEEKAETVNNTLLWSLIGAGVVIVIAAGVYVLLVVLKKKKAE